MHSSSYENMQKCVNRYLGEPFFRAGDKLVVDIGSSLVNGSYRGLFEEMQGEYCGVDLAPGPGVDVVLDDPYRLPFPDGCADVVLSGQMLEHCEFFWQAFREMVRILTPQGYLFLIAPSAGCIHRHPVDCYRFYPDGFAALAKYAGCHAVAIWRDERGPWRDLVGVFSKDAAAVGRPPHPLRFKTQNAAPAFDAEADVRSGKTHYRSLLSMIHEHCEPRSYLEIGVRRGESLALARCPSIAIDPEPEDGLAIGHHVRLFRTTSDGFFEDHAADAMQLPLDLAFIDGMHLFEFALRDFMNVERHAHHGTIVVIDDIFPNHPRQAERRRTTRAWCGDIWKLAHCLADHRPDLRLIPLDTRPTGLLIVLGLHPGNRVLWDNYDIILGARSMYRSDDPPPETVLKRHGAFDPEAPHLVTLMEEVRAARDRRNVRRLIGAAVRDYRAAQPADTPPST